MKNYVIEIQHDNGIVTIKTKARNIQAAFEAVSQSENCPRGAMILRWEGRKGEWNEYVEFDPRRMDGVVFVAQKCQDHWNVFENHPGRKGTVKTIATYKQKYRAVQHAQNLGHG